MAPEDMTSQEVRAALAVLGRQCWDLSRALQDMQMKTMDLRVRLSEFEEML